ncbi:MAG: hypothetical protein IT324_25060 [Anaerolineae bacterium]|nr:hypothetical protein [Anaerolineae bacterium]
MLNTPEQTSEPATETFDTPTSPWTDVFQAAQDQAETQTPARHPQGAQPMPQSEATTTADDPTHNALSTIFNGN